MLDYLSFHFAVSVGKLTGLRELFQASVVGHKLLFRVLFGLAKKIFLVSYIFLWREVGCERVDRFFREVFHR